MKTGRAFHTVIYLVRVFAFACLVLLLMLKRAMLAQDASLWTAGVWRSLMSRGLKQRMAARSVNFQWSDSDIILGQVGKRLWIKYYKTPFL